MPLRSQREALRRKRQIQRSYFPGAEATFLGKSDARDARSSRTEDARRRADAVAASAAGPDEPVTIPLYAPTVSSTTVPVTLPDIIDRFHKYAFNEYGGYIRVAKNHSPSDPDPVPNPGYAVSGRASTLKDAYDKAVLMNAIVVRARIAIVIVNGTWFEDLMIADKAIDFWGEGRPVVSGHWVVTPESDAKFFDIEFSTPDESEALVYLAHPMDDPTVLPAEIRRCDFFGYGRVLRMQRRFYMDHCQIKQTYVFGNEDAAEQKHNREDRIPFIVENLVPIPVNPNIPEYDGGWSVMKDCRVESWMRADGASGIRPGGWAMYLKNFVPGVKSRKLDGTDTYITKDSGLILEDCDIKGSVLVEAWLLKHSGGRQRAGLSTPDAAGGIYLVLRGEPMLDVVNGFVGNRTAEVYFDNCETTANAIALFDKWPGAAGPDNGLGYVSYRNSNHLRRADGAYASPWLSGGGAAVADVVESPTGCLNWIKPGVNVTLYGSCPTNVIGNIDHYMV